MTGPEEAQMQGHGTTVITISRQTASGGAYVGHLVAKKLGYKYIERSVLHSAAQELGIEIPALSAQDERVSGFVDNLMKGYVFGTPEAAYLIPSRRPVYDDELFEAESRIIREIAARHDAVVVGHCGFSVLRGRQRLLNVLIHAPKEFRAERLKKVHGIPAGQALAELEESDGRRAKYVRTMAHAEWLDATNYHLSLDARAVGFEAAAGMIIELKEKVLVPTPR